MLTHLPLDDELNQLFYFEEGVWRLVWANALGRCVLRREQPNIGLADAVLLIARGEVLWAPPDKFDCLSDATPVDAVQRERLLLMAFLRSPAGRRLSRWSVRRRIELRVSDDREWLATHALARGDADATGEE